MPILLFPIVSMTYRAPTHAVLRLQFAATSLSCRWHLWAITTITPRLVVLRARTRLLGSSGMGGWALAPCSATTSGAWAWDGSSVTARVLSRQSHNISGMRRHTSYRRDLICSSVISPIIVCRQFRFVAAWILKKSCINCKHYKPYSLRLVDAYQWLNVRLQYLQCDRRGDTAVLQ